MSDAKLLARCLFLAALCCLGAVLAYPSAPAVSGSDVLRGIGP